MTFRRSFQLLALSSLIAACGGPLTYTVHGTPFAPEADATIVADVHKDGDFTTLKLDVEHLVSPDRLGGSSAFVVWTKGDAPKWHRVGALKYDEKGAKGTIDGASVPVTAFDLKVTAEKSVEPEAPSDTVVVSQHIN